MDGRRKPVKDSKPRRPRRGKAVSVESVIFLFGLLNAGTDKAVIERAFKLGLRGPDLIKSGLRFWLESQGVDIDAFMNGEPIDPASQAEVKEMVEPALKRAAEMAAFAQIADLYIFGKAPTPKSLLYAFYIGTRFALVRERKPTKGESKLIWEIALWITQNSKIGAPHWRKLESRGEVYLKDWIQKRKDDARKKYETFLNQKRRAEATAEESLTSLVSDIFGSEEAP